jgi:hypothetical protein
MRFRFIQVHNFWNYYPTSVSLYGSRTVSAEAPFYWDDQGNSGGHIFTQVARRPPADAPMAVSCSPLRFEAELAGLRGRDGVGRGQFLIGSHIQRLCDVHSSDGGCSRTRTCDPLIKSFKFRRFPSATDCCCGGTKPLQLAKFSDTLEYQDNTAGLSAVVPRWCLAEDWWNARQDHETLG